VRGGWDFGFNLVAASAGIGETAILHRDRYHYIWGPEIGRHGHALMDGGSTNGSYYPLTFGFRF
jgi:hypothetical protein